MSMFYSLPTLIAAEIKDSGLPLDGWIASKFSTEEFEQMKALHSRLEIGEYRNLFCEMVGLAAQVQSYRTQIEELLTKCHAPQVASAIAEMESRVFAARKLVSSLGTEKDLEQLDEVVSEILAMDREELATWES